MGWWWTVKIDYGLLIQSSKLTMAYRCTVLIDYGLLVHSLKLTMDCWCTAIIDYGLLVHCQNWQWAAGALSKFTMGCWCWCTVQIWLWARWWTMGCWCTVRTFFLPAALSKKIQAAPGGAWLCQSTLFERDIGREEVGSGTSLHCSKEILEEKRLARALVYTVLKGYWKRRGWLGH